MPELLKKYKSEYNYLFYLLKTFIEHQDKQNFEQLFLLPNVLRRFFEMYLFMRYPDGKNFNDKANTFFTNTNNETEKIMALKIMNEYSHEENPEHSQKFPDIQELISSMAFILKSIENRDKEHYEALTNSVKNV